MESQSFQLFRVSLKSLESLRVPELINVDL